MYCVINFSFIIIACVSDVSIINPGMRLLAGDPEFESQLFFSCHSFFQEAFIYVCFILIYKKITDKEMQELLEGNKC